MSNPMHYCLWKGNSNNEVELLAKTATLQEANAQLQALTSHIERLTYGTNGEEFFLIELTQKAQARMVTACNLLTRMVPKAHFSVEATYEDFGANMQWITIFVTYCDERGNLESYQALSSRQWKQLVDGSLEDFQHVVAEVTADAKRLTK